MLSREPFGMEHQMSDTDQSHEASEASSEPPAEASVDASAEMSAEIEGGATDSSLDFSAAPTIADVAAWRAVLEEGLSAGSTRHFDAREWGEEAGDTAGIAVLLSAFKSAETLGGTLTVALPEEGGFRARLHALGLSEAQFTFDDNGFWSGLAA